MNLTYAALHALIRLVIARGNSATGFLRLSPVTIARLRQALGRAAGRDSGAALIETGCGEEYHLNIPREDLARRVAIDPSFFELEELRVLSAEEAQQLRRLCRVLKSS